MSDYSEWKRRQKYLDTAKSYTLEVADTFGISRGVKLSVGNPPKLYLVSKRRGHTVTVVDFK